MNRRMSFKWFILFFALMISHLSISQIFTNPSFEDSPRESVPPEGWFGCESNSTPDTQPGFWGVNSPPSNGLTYVSIVTRGGQSFDNVESMTTELKSLDPSTCYFITLDLAHSDTFNFNGRFRPIRLNVWASSNQCEKEKLIWASQVVSHASWQPYTFNISGNYRYITLEAAYPGDEKINGNILIDNIQVSESSLDLGENKIICHDESVELIVDYIWKEITWNNGSKDRSITVVEGDYIVNVVNGNCMLSDTINITATKPLEKAQKDKKTICIGDSISIDVSVPNGFYKWNTGSNSPSLTIYDEGLYSVEISNGCESTTREIDVSIIEKCCSISAPNVITPNSDGKNETFIISTEANLLSYELKIFNRWGKLLYNSKNVSEFWDGKYNSKVVAAGIYYWTVKITCATENNNRNSEFKGIVSVIY